MKAVKKPTPIRKEILLNRAPLKGFMDTAAITKVLLTGNVMSEKPVDWSNRLKCLSFYFDAGGVDCLHATMPRSGSHWSELGLSLAIDLANGGDGEYRFESDLYVPRNGFKFKRLDWRAPTGEWDECQRMVFGPSSIGAHAYWHSRLPYHRIRSGRLKEMKIVLLVRSIVVSIAALNLKQNRISENREIFQNNAKFANWNRYLTHSIEFFNSWGDAMQWHPNIRLYRYEDLVKDPVSGHKEILDFWGFDIPEECVQEAFLRATPEEMEKRMTPDQRRDSHRLPTPVEDSQTVMPEYLKRDITNRLQRDLIYDFGYEYNHDTEFDFSFL